MKNVSSGPVITLPQDPELVARLRLKLTEYDVRKHKVRYHPPEQEPDLWHRWFLLELLLRTGEVRTWDASRIIGKEGWFYLEAFESACHTIECYCTGKPVRGDELPPSSE